MTPFNDIRRVTSDTLPASYGPDRERPLVVTLHHDGHGDWILLRPLGTTRTVRLLATDVYRLALMHASRQIQALAAQLMRDHGYRRGRAIALAAKRIFYTPPQQSQRTKEAL